MPMTGDRLAKLNAAHEFDTWYKPRRPLHTSVNHVELHRFAAERIGRETNLRYLEFGVYQGASMRRAAALYTNPDTNFFGFDSFEGLPERWITMQAGHFAPGGEPPAVKDPRVQFHKGWFQNTVRDFLPTLNRDPTKTTLVHFDADLYSSTLFLLTSLWWHIPEYFFIFDEFFGEELLAMKNFVTAYPVAFEFLACVESGAGQPRQLFGRLRNIEMVVGSAASAQEL